MRRTRQIDMRRALVLDGLFTFLLSCSRACLLPFLTLYLRQLGLPPTMIGIIIGTKHLITLVWSPASSLLFKLYNKRRVAISWSLALSAALPLLLLLLPSLNPDTSRYNAICHSSNTSKATTPHTDQMMLATTASPTAKSGTIVSSALVSPSGITASVEAYHSDASPTAVTSRTWPQTKSSSLQKNTSDWIKTKFLASPGRMRSLPKPAQHSEEMKDGKEHHFLSSLKAMDPQHQLFFLVLITVSLWEVASASVDWTGDDGLYEYLDYADASDRYDSTGRWGLLGAACGVMGSGLLVSRLICLAADGTATSAAHFYCYSCVAVATLSVALGLPMHLNRKRDRANGLLRAMRLVRASPRTVLCAVSTLLAGAAWSAVSDFLLWHMQDQGSSELHMGLALALGLLLQAAFPLLAGPLSRLLSPSRVLAMSLASLGVQCFYYSLLWGPWAVLPAQTLSCFSSGAFWWAVKVQCNDVATPGAERSVWRVCGTLSFHLGNGLGSFAGGLVVQRFGVTWLFLGASAVLMLWCICLALMQWKTPHQQRINYSRLLAADASETSDSDSEQENDWLDKAMEVDRSNNNLEWRINH